MLLKLGMRAAGLMAAAAPDAYSPVATAEPVWPVAGADSASATIDDLEAQGYDVQINWVSGLPSFRSIDARSPRSTTPTTSHRPTTPWRRFMSTSRVRTQMTTPGAASASESVSDRDSDPGQREKDRVRVAGRETPSTRNCGVRGGEGAVLPGRIDLERDRPR